ncbi:MAG: hypothetical protein JWM56_9 [Candidatus Peribacteria bacterium]|nr:hypothetical protein [Candidatus Peribacteria bacterium]
MSGHTNISFWQRLTMQKGFTLLELLVSVGIIGALASITVVAIGPRKILLAAHDRERSHQALELSKARTQKQIDASDWVDTPPLPDGHANAVPICEPGMTRDSSCINLDYLIPDYLAAFKKDNVEPCGYLGYEIFKESGKIMILPKYLGKMAGDSATRTCITDTIAPEITNVVSDAENFGNPKITWDTDEPSTTQVEYGLTTSYGNVTTLKDYGDNLVSAHEATLEGLLGYTQYHYRVKSRDNAGNLGHSIDYTFTTTDTTPPVITAVVSNSITDGGATFTWTTDEPSRSQVEYWVEFFPHDYFPSSPTQILTIDHTVTVTGLLPDTAYSFNVGSRDAKSNFSKSADFPFRTLPDITPPSISAITTSNITSSDVTVSWKTNEASTTRIEYGTTTAYDTPTTLSGAKVTTHSQVITGLQAETLYHYRVKSMDASGNEAVSDDQTVYVHDVTTPTLSPIAINNNTGTSALLTWTTGENSNTQLEYGTTTSYGTTTTLVSTPTLNHSVQLTNLTQNTLYYIRAKSYDAASNMGTMTGSFTSTNLSPVLSGISVTPTAYNSAFTWTTNKFADTQLEYGTTTSYGTIPGNLSTLVKTPHSITAPSLSANTLYYYKISSKDANNYTGISTGTFTTSPAPAQSLVAQWTFDEATGTTAADGTGNGNTATHTSGPTSSAVVAPIGATNTNSRLYNGSNYTTTPNLRKYFADESVTISAWFYPTAGGVIISETGDNTAGSNVWHNSQIEVLGTGQVKVSVYALTAISVGNVSFNTWNHVAVRYLKTGATTGQLSGFLNGVKATTVISGDRQAPWESNNTLYYGIGRADGTHMGDGTGFNGNIDEVHIFNYARSDAEIQAEAANATFDTTPPTLSNVRLLNNYGTSISLVWDASEPVTTQRIAYGIGNYNTFTTTGTTLNTLGLSQTISNPALTPGTVYQYRLESKDGAKNLGTLIGTFTTAADTFGATFTGPSGAPTASGGILTWTTNEPANTQVEYGTSTLYGTSSPLINTLTYSHTVVLQGLNPGTQYNFRVKAMDANGNPSVSGNAVFTPDNTPPVITNVVPTMINSTTANISWTTTGDTSNSIVDYGTTVSYGSSPSNAANVTNHSLNITVVTNQTYHFRVRSRDIAGNTGTSSDYSFIADFTAPTLTAGPTVTSTDGVHATITWTTNEVSDTQMDYGATTGYGTPSTLNTTMVTSHSVVLSSLSANTLYHFRVKSRDPTGNLFTSGDYTFTTVDTTPPILSARTATVTSDTSATISWTTQEDSTTQVEYGPTSAYGNQTSLDTTLAPNHSQNLTGLMPNTTYHFHVKSRDAAGNTSTSPDETFTTTDTTGPTISNMTAHTITDVRATISWTTSEAAGTVVDYGTSTSYGLTASTTESATSHSQLLTGLAPNNTYYYRVRSTDSAGNETIAPGDSFSTLLDVTPPVISGVASSAITESSAVISWTTNEGADGQIDYGTTTSYGSQTTLSGAMTLSHQQSLGGLSVNTLYHYRVRSRDSHNNLSVSADATITTVDTTAPVISAVASAVPNDTTATITWTTNEVSNSQVEYGTTTSYGTYGTINASMVTNHNQSLTGLAPNTKYYYNVKSRDPAGFLTTSAGFLFITDVTPPVLINIASGTLTTNSATITWSTDEPADSVVEYGTSAGSYPNTSTPNSTLSITKTHLLSGLANNTTYYYRVKSHDEAGNLATSAEKTFSTDVTPPTISAASATPDSATATITWTTNEVAGTSVDYGTAGYTQNAATAGNSTLHTQTLSGLTPATPYMYRITTTDPAGNTSTSTGTFTTNP